LCWLQSFAEKEAWLRELKSTKHEQTI